MRRALLGFLLLTIAACDSLPRHVDDADCRDWAEIYTARSREAMRAATLACAHEAKAPQVLEDKMMRNVDELHDKNLKEGWLRVCRKEIGQKYMMSEVKCLRDAKTVKDWDACDFKLHVLYELKGYTKNITGYAERECQHYLEGSEGWKP